MKISHGNATFPVWLPNRGIFFDILSDAELWPGEMFDYCQWIVKSTIHFGRDRQFFGLMQRATGGADIFINNPLLEFPIPSGHPKSDALRRASSFRLLARRDTLSKKRLSRQVHFAARGIALRHNNSPHS